VRRLNRGFVQLDSAEQLQQNEHTITRALALIESETSTENAGRDPYPITDQEFLTLGQLDQPIPLTLPETIDDQAWHPAPAPRRHW
jgi:hypothetical protein